MPFYDNKYAMFFFILIDLFSQWPPENDNKLTIGVSTDQTEAN